jgi:hypothetical protein
MGGHGRGLSACGGSAAAAPNALGVSGAGPGNMDVDMDHDDDEDDNDNDYEDNALDSDDNDDNDDNVPGEAVAPLEDETLHQVHLLANVVCTNQDYGLGLMVPRPDASTAASAVFEAVELQAPTFFASHLLMRTGRFSEVDPLISFCCL